MATRTAATTLLLLCALVSTTALACNKPKLGGKCEVGQALCESATQVMACQGGTFVEAQCHGPTGCATNGASVSCDDSTADVGEACLESGVDNRACSRDKTTSLLCTGGKFKAVQVCRGADGCAIKGDAVTCDATRALKGDTCTSQGAFACAPDMKSRLVCNGGAFAFDRFCKGPSGCHAGDYECDETVSDVGDPCGVAGMAACASDGVTELVCTAGAYFAARDCKRGCRATGKKIDCKL